MEEGRKHVTRDLPVFLEDVDIEEKGKLLAAAEKERKRIKKEAKDKAAHYRTLAGEQTEKIDKLEAEINGGFATVEVACEEISAWPGPTTVVRLDSRDKEGRKLPPGSPFAIVEERAPEESIVEGAAKPKGRAKKGTEERAPEESIVEGAAKPKGRAKKGTAAEAAPADGDAAPESGSKATDTRTLSLFEEQALAGQRAVAEAPADGEGAEPPAEGDASAEGTPTAKRPRRKLQAADPAAAS